MLTLEEIKDDLSAFADPGSMVDVDSSHATWEQDGAIQSLQLFQDSDGGLPIVEFRGKRMPYRHFLAGPGMADLRRLAEVTLRLGAGPENLIPTDAALAKQDGEMEYPSRQEALALLRRTSVDDLPYLATRLIFVRGEAGAGKTVVLKTLRTLTARDYLSRKIDRLFFYVDAQGKALARLDDALAKELDDVRARFPYRAIIVLTRRNLLIPIIDGFDELLGSGGYEDAFSSLASFLESLSGQGTVVASARSSFFDYRDFYENAKRFSGPGNRLRYDTATVDVLPWDEEKISTFFRQEGVAEIFESFYGRTDKENRALLGKPFYAAKAADLFRAGFRFNSNSTMLEQLVEAFLEREVSKLRDRDGSSLLDIQGHRDFLTALADEMWWQESRRLDVGTVQTVAELVVESLRLPPSTARKIVERVSSYAFLSSSLDRKTLGFEHEVFYGYFLAQRFKGILETGPSSDLRRFLSRSVLDDTLIENTVRMMGQDSEKCSAAIDAISAVMRPKLSDVVARENGGLLFVAFAMQHRTLRSGILVNCLILRRARLGGLTLDKPVFESCDFFEVDLTAVKMECPIFRNSILRDTIIDEETTRLSGAELRVPDDVNGLIVRGDDRRTYNPEQVAGLLTGIGVKVANMVSRDSGKAYSPAVVRRIALVDRLVRRSMSRFYFGSDDNNETRAIFRDPEWSLVERLLRENELLEEAELPRSGPNRLPLLRLTVPPSVLRRGEDPASEVDPAIRRFWQRLTQG